MRKLLIIMLFFCCSCSRKAYLFTSFHEPATDGLRLLYSKDALQWEELPGTFLAPKVGKQKVMRDPSLIQGPDGTFHLVWTSSWRSDAGFGYASSKDLIHWSEQRLIKVMEHEPKTVNVWAPELFYDEQADDFIIIWASAIPGRFPKGTEEEDNNQRMYFSRTKDFRTFSKGQLFADPGFSVIDAMIVKRAKSDYVLVLKDNTRANRNLKVAFSESAVGPFRNVSAPFSGKLTEGPAVIGLKEKWLIYYDAYGEKRYAAVETNDFKSFKDISAQTSIPEGHKHGTIVKVRMKILRQLIKESTNKSAK